MGKRIQAASVVFTAAVIAGCGSNSEEDGATTIQSGKPTQEVPPNWFEEVATERGIEFTHQSGHRESHLMPETMGGGVALFDMDGDGDLDAYLVQSGSLYPDAGPQPTNRLFENLGAGSFVDVTADRGGGDTGYGMGVACGDADGDGDVDLYITNLGPNTLLLNDGSGHFTDGTVAAGVADPHWGSSAAFLDLENDGDLDLYICNYLDWKIGSELPCKNQMGAPDFCSPLNYDTPARDTVYLNNGDGTFTDWSAEFGTVAMPATGLGVACADFDSDGRLEIFVANDGMPNFLWVPTANGWKESGSLRGCALDGDGVPKAGMGVDIEDIDGDGDPDLLVCNLRDQSDSFYRNDGSLFRDRTAASGLATLSSQFTRFGLGWVDFDNDGMLDLYEANGRVMRQSHTYSEDPYAEPNLLWRGEAGGRFAIVEPRGGLANQAPFNSRGAAFGDVDNDGGMDVLVVNVDGPAQLFRNVADSRGHWALFELSNGERSALHARVAISVGDDHEYRYARAAASYQASNDPRVHFGLGVRATASQVTVTWPDGFVEEFGDYAANKIHRLTRGAGKAR